MIRIPNFTKSITFLHFGENFGENFLMPISFVLSAWCLNLKGWIDMAVRNIFRELRQNYPEQVSMEQMRRICHISKRHASYLLENKIVPCKDSGKKTRKYTIELMDIAKYLAYRPALPKGLFSKQRKRHSAAALDNSPQYIQTMRKHYEIFLADKPDILGTEEIGKILERDRRLVLRYINSGRLKAIMVGKKYHISKEGLIDFLVSIDFRTSCSKEFTGIFEEVLPI